MNPKTRYVFTASMDVDPDKEALFNEVYDQEHIPELLKVPGAQVQRRLRAGKRRGADERGMGDRSRERPLAGAGSPAHAQSPTHVAQARLERGA